MRYEVQLLKNALEHYSPTGSTDDMGAFLINWCEDRGLQAELKNGMVVVNPEAKEILMLGHMDTVPGALPVSLQDEVLTGRGAADAKGPLSAALAALEKHKGLWDKVCLTAVPDEEGPSVAAKYIRDQWSERPVIILEPSTWCGITLSYMGRLFIRCSASCPPSHSGHMTPFAAEVLFTTWNQLSKDHHARIRNVTGNETDATMELDVRFKDATVDEILKQLPDDVNIEVIEKTMPYTADKNTKLTRAFLRAIRDSGGTPVFKKKTGTSDMNVLGENWKDAPMLAYGPGDGKLGHTDFERIEINEYLKGIEVYETALEYLCKSEE